MTHILTWLLRKFPLPAHDGYDAEDPAWQARELVWLAGFFGKGLAFLILITAGFLLGSFPLLWLAVLIGLWWRVSDVSK
jgi:4-amino-4-deoxy-L-arabinose transferase-like glycosyltransferase